MLQQILQDLYVDPELLAKLDDDQKQQLFCHMREEQVRRWKIWDEEQQRLEVEQKIFVNKNKTKKKVQFLMGDDNEPWVWVMGEHPDDKSIEQILEQEAIMKAFDFAKEEAEELRELIHSGETWRNSKSDEFEIYNSTNKNEPALLKSSTNKPVETDSNNREILEELKLKQKQSGVASRVAQWEQRVMVEKSLHILQTLQKRKQECVHEAEENDLKQEALWLDQERKAKEAEQQIREIARRAREEHRRSSSLTETTSPPISPLRNISTTPSNDEIVSSYSSFPSTNHPKTVRPPNKEAIYEWFHKKEHARRAGVDPSTNEIAPWFHGLISRQVAELLLKNEKVGTFLVRVSEKIWGYAISLKEEDRCKHFLVEASDNHYQFPGLNQMTHKTLADLVSFHSWVPITVEGNELLREPCVWSTPPEMTKH